MSGWALHNSGVSYDSGGVYLEFSIGASGNYGGSVRFTSDGRAQTRRNNTGAWGAWLTLTDQWYIGSPITNIGLGYEIMWVDGVGTSPDSTWVENTWTTINFDHSLTLLSDGPEYEWSGTVYIGIDGTGVDGVTGTAIASTSVHLFASGYRTIY